MDEERERSICVIDVEESISSTLLQGSVTVRTDPTCYRPSHRTLLQRGLVEHLNFDLKWTKQIPVDDEWERETKINLGSLLLVMSV